MKCLFKEHATINLAILDLKSDALTIRLSIIKLETQLLLSTEKFSEMKDEIPQSVIDSHVKNAANARAEKVKHETSEENKGKKKMFKRATKNDLRP